MLNGIIDRLRRLLKVKRNKGYLQWLCNPSILNMLFSLIRLIVEMTHNFKH